MKWIKWCVIGLFMLLIMVPDVFAGVIDKNETAGVDRGILIADNDEEDVWGESSPMDMEEDAGSAWDEGGWEETESETADADRMEFSGAIRVRVASDVKEQNKFEDDGYGHGKLKLKTKYTPSDQIQIVASVSGEYFLYANDNHYRNDDTIRFDDTYINFSNPRFNFKIGNQVVRWGKTDGYSPIDNLNPEDYRNGIAGRREDRKLPIPMANIEIYQGTMTLQGIFIPFFYKPKFDLEGTDWAMFKHGHESIGPFKIDEGNTTKKINDSEFGLRFSGIIQNLNYALSWFHTREDLPIPDSLIVTPGFVLPPGDFSPMELAEFAVLTGQPVKLDHDRQNIFGLEIETTWRVFGIRADVAYSDDNSLLTDELQQVRKPAVRGTVGFDYNSPNAWYTNLQYSRNVILDYDSNIVWSDETTDALTGTFRKDFSNGDFQAECRIYFDLADKGTLINPKFIMTRWHPFKFELGTEIFDGSVETPIGYYSENDQIYALMECKF